jgi:hypothetical protein
VPEVRTQDLGKLLFGFSSFWMYLWFCQYMLTWYVNNPEEAIWYTRRLRGGWTSLFLLNIVLNWVIPFLVLLPRATKQRVGVLAAVSLVILAGRWLDLYIQILPRSGDAPLAGAPWEIGLAAGATGLATRAIEYSSRRGENVLDLFGGSGSTLIAAEQTGRKAFLMELDPLYCDVIVQRYEQFSGRKAERVCA